MGEKEETIERWRFDRLRASAIVALEKATDLLRHREEGNYIDDVEVFHDTVFVVASLAKGIKESTEP